MIYLFAVIGVLVVAYMAARGAGAMYRDHVQQQERLDTAEKVLKDRANKADPHA